MTAAPTIAATGLTHQQARLRAAAHNTANLSTPDTAVLGVAGREVGPGGGVRAATTARVEHRPQLGSSQAPTPGPRATAVEAASTRISAVRAAGARISAVRAAGAQAAAVRTADDMLGALLDLTA